MSELADDVSVKMPGLVPQPHGGAILSGGVPGHIGGPGRPPGMFKEALRAIREDPKLAKAIAKAAQNGESRGFSSALKVLTEYDDEKPAEKHTIVGPVVVQVQIVREGKKNTSG